MWFCLWLWHSGVFLVMIMARWCVSVYNHGKVMCLWSWQGDMFLLVAGTMAAWAVQGQRTCSVTRRLAVTWCAKVRASWAPLFYPTWAKTTRSPTSGVCIYVWCVYIIYMCMVCVVHALYRLFVTDTVQIYSGTLLCPTPLKSKSVFVFKMNQTVIL